MCRQALDGLLVYPDGDEFFEYPCDLSDDYPYARTPEPGVPYLLRGRCADLCLAALR